MLYYMYISALRVIYVVVLIVYTVYTIVLSKLLIGSYTMGTELKFTEKRDADVLENNIHVNARSARTNFSKLVDTTRIDKKRVVITEYGEPAAAIAQYTQDVQAGRGRRAVAVRGGALQKSGPGRLPGDLRQPGLCLAR